MSRTVRLLGAVAFCVALSPFASAQWIDCDNVPLSAGAVDHAYRACVPPSDAPPTSAGPSDRSFGHDGVNTNFVTFAQNVPEVFTTVGPYVPPVFLGALDFEGDDLSTAYGLETSNLAISINANTGAVTNLGTLTPQFGEQWTAIAWDYVDETFYALATVCGSQTSLYEVSFSPPSATLIGTDATGNETCGLGLASDPTTGVLYGYGVVSDQLVRYNKTTGQSTVIGPLGYSANFGQAMDFDNDDGTCYIYAFNDIAFQAELRTCNTATGTTTLVGALGSTVPGGLTQIGAGASMIEETVDSPLSFNGSITATPNPVAPGETVTFSGRVVNDGAQGRQASINLRYSRVGGPPSGSINLGSGTVPPTGGTGVPFSRSVRVPPSAPEGLYELIFELIDEELISVARRVVARDTVDLTVTRPGATGEGRERSAPALSVPDVAWEAVTDNLLTTSAEATTAPSAVSPNPFSGRTQIGYAVEAAAHVRLSVYDVLGREVAVLVDRQVEAGLHAATFDANGLAAGTYVYRLQIGSAVQTGRMTLTR